MNAWRKVSSRDGVRHEERSWSAQQDGGGDGLKPLFGTKPLACAVQDNTLLLLWSDGFLSSSGCGIDDLPFLSADLLHLLSELTPLWEALTSPTRPLLVRHSIQLRERLLHWLLRQQLGETQIKWQNVPWGDELTVKTGRLGPLEFFSAQSPYTQRVYLDHPTRAQLTSDFGPLCLCLKGSDDKHHLNLLAPLGQSLTQAKWTVAGLQRIYKQEIGNFAGELSAAAYAQVLVSGYGYQHTTQPASASITLHSNWIKVAHELEDPDVSGVERPGIRLSLFELAQAQIEQHSSFYTATRAEWERHKIRRLMQLVYPKESTHEN